LLLLKENCETGIEEVAGTYNESLTSTEFIHKIEKYFNYPNIFLTGIGIL